MLIQCARRSGKPCAVFTHSKNSSAGIAASFSVRLFGLMAKSLLKLGHHRFVELELADELTFSRFLSGGNSLLASKWDRSKESFKLRPASGIALPPERAGLTLHPRHRGDSLGVESVGTTSGNVGNALFHPRCARAVLSSPRGNLKVRSSQDRFQQTLHAQAFRFQITHGGLQRVVSHRGLEDQGSISIYRPVNVEKELSVIAMPQRKHLFVGGLVAMGFDATGKYLLTVSHSGRGVFSADSWERVARDATLAYPSDGKAVGIGPIDGQLVKVVERDARRDRIEMQSPDGTHYLVGESDGIILT